MTFVESLLVAITLLLVTIDVRLFYISSEIKKK